MPHIHTLPGQYDLTASAYVIRTDVAEPALMLHRHKKLGLYLQFGGHVELDENPWQAVRHELLEESGFDMDQLHILQPDMPPLKTSHGVLHPFPVANISVQFGELDHYHTDIGYAFTASSPPRGRLKPGESAEISLFTRKQLVALPSGSIPENVREIGLYIFDVCLNSWSLIETNLFAS